MEAVDEEALEAIMAMTAILPTKLNSRNNDVDFFNNQQLQSLGSEIIEFRAKDAGREPHLTNLKNGTKAPELLQLAVGAQVQ